MDQDIRKTPLKVDKERIQIRGAKPDDAEELLAIYAPYVEHTAISFEYDVPSLKEFQGRIEHTLAHYPYLVAEVEDKIVGYCYAGPFVGREAYSWACEMTVYIAMDSRRCGIGGKLYKALEQELRKKDILNLEACIGVPKKEDEYLTNNSVEFHAHMGYRMVGQFDRCGYKFGRWYDMAWMEKIIGKHEADPDLVHKPLI